MRSIGSQLGMSVLLIVALLFALAGCSTGSSGLDWDSDAFKQRLAQVRDNGLASDSARVFSRWTTHYQGFKPLT